MKICIAQTRSEKGMVQRNMENHLTMIEKAVLFKADLILFPELSLTNYEPEIAAELATDIQNDLFNPFQEIANKTEISIAFGMPAKTVNGTCISTLIFQPHQARQVYSKQILHEDELPYFVAGEIQVILKIGNLKIALGICYESLHREHFLNAKKMGADIYLASVAKSQTGIEKANEHFPKMAREFSTPILMANCVGRCDNFLSAGQSSVWNRAGEQVAQLNNQNQGLIIYDLISGGCHTDN